MPRQLRRSMPNVTIELHEDAPVDLGVGTQCVHCVPRRTVRLRTKVIRWLRRRGIALVEARALVDDYRVREPGEVADDGG